MHSVLFRSMVPLSLAIAGLVVVPACGANPVSNPNTASALDGFDPTADNRPRVLAIQPDGRILLGGDFMTVGGQPRTRRARLLPDGRLDLSFIAAAVDGTIYAMAVQAAGPSGVTWLRSAGIVEHTRQFFDRLFSDGFE
jgi:hypothetical protein